LPHLHAGAGEKYGCCRYGKGYGKGSSSQLAMPNVVSRDPAVCTCGQYGHVISVPCGQYGHVISVPCGQCGHVISVSCGQYGRMISAAIIFFVKS
jgi:hypothetical protein